jgi:exonuclease V gamma subunit
MSNDLLSNTQLRDKLNSKQDAQIIRWLNERGIRWDRDTKGRPVTTLGQIEKHLEKETHAEVDF